MPTNIAWAVLQWCLKDALLPSSLEPKKEQTCPLLPARPRQGLPWRGSREASQPRHTNLQRRSPPSNIAGLDKTSKHKE